MRPDSLRDTRTRTRTVRLELGTKVRVWCMPRKDHTRVFLKDIVRTTYEKKMVLGCIQIMDIQLKHFPESYIFDL